ncbi:tumor necrosis factor receptor superfamily member wengen [Oratosquilla oratoria]|uniref:tumor necrosis factor receptor superfamily member wengen n=1 Tax=Oratosquilla oratoria TaxID=337810 RepID=UPI003F777C34
MLGRVWWGLVWTVCMITVVSSSPCHEGVEYYNSGEGRCVPCTRCEGHLVVVIKCYVYQDAVCAPVQAVIRGGPLPSEHSLEEEEEVKKQNENQSRSVIQHRKDSFDHHDVPRFQNFSAIRSTREKGSFKDPDVEGEREVHHKDRKGRRRPKEEKGSRPLRHRHPSHRKVQSHRQASSSEDVVTHSNDSYTSGAIDMSVVSLSDVWRGPEDPSDSMEWTGASSAKNPEGLEEDKMVKEEEGEEKEKEQRQGWDWQTVVYISTALIVVLSLILLIKAVLCHISCSNKKRLARQEGEAQVVTQLLPCEPHIVPRETQVVQSQQQQRQHLQQQLLQNHQQSMLPVHQYPDAAYTMDRLLERRRVTESLETNLYVDSCRRDSQANVLQLFPSTPVLSQTGGPVVGGSVSASTTPRVQRVYRARGAPVSASASPVISSRNASLWNSLMTGAGRQQGGVPVSHRGGQST